MIGRTLGRYKITAKLGEGGMGSVWLAEDTLLGRAVALKLLASHLAASDAARQRFIREARAASRLSHAGIATVFDAGEADGQVFIAYELVEGETLAARLARGPLALADLLHLARGAAEALAHAHARDVLHRDLTAGNVMLRPDGAPVIVDFGLARAQGDVTLTSTGTTLGTAPYLAPEQWRGESGDARTDLWSLGVVLYLAATGQQPFAGETPEAVMYRVLNEEPVKPTKLRSELPAKFERLVLRLLEKDARDRLGSAAELAAGLASIASTELEVEAPPMRGDKPVVRMQRWWRKQVRKKFGFLQSAAVAIAAAAVLGSALFFQRKFVVRRQQILAVLPMRNVSTDPEGAAHIGEALGEELVGRLGTSRAVQVLPWATTGRYANPRGQLAGLGRELHADILLVGTFRADSDRIEVQAELVDGHTGMDTWSERFMHADSELIALQNELASGVLRRLNPAFGVHEQRRLRESTPANPEAYDYFIRGANYWHSDDPATQALAEPFFRKAVELDSTLAGAWVGLGALMTDRYFRGVGGNAGLDQAEANFRRALRLRPGLPVAERGTIRVINEKWESTRGAENKSIRCAEMAIAALRRDPNDVEQLETAALGLLLCHLPELALPAFNRGLAIDPQNQGMSWYRVVGLAWSGHPQRCLAAGADYIRRFGEDLEVYTWMGASARAVGRLDEAVTYLSRAVDLARDSPAHYSTYQLGRVYKDRGDVASVRRLYRNMVDQLERQAAATPDNSRLVEKLAETYLQLGDTTRAAQLYARFPRFVGDGWEDLARRGRVRDAIALVSQRSPDRDWFWAENLDSAGVAPMLGHEPEPSLRAVYASPEYQRNQAAIDRRQYEFHEHYRRICAQWFRNDPDFPKFSAQRFGKFAQ